MSIIPMYKNLPPGVFVLLFGVAYWAIPAYSPRWLFELSQMCLKLTVEPLELLHIIIKAASR